MGISKTKYVRGIGCEKLLWLDEHMPEVAADTENTLIAEQGTLVGKLAQGLYGPHEVVPYSRNKKEMIRDTEEMLRRNVPVICEASFAYENAFCSVDLLIGHGDRQVDIVEVKSSAGMDPVYIDDATFQTWVLNRCGFTVGKVSIAHINTKYVRQGELDIHQLFIQEDITGEVNGKLAEVEANLNRLLEIQKADTEPSMDFGKDCPACAYWGYCSRNLPRPNVFDLPGEAGFNKNHKYKLYQKGYITYEQLQDRPELKKRQQMTIRGALHGEEHIDREKIRECLDGLSFPLYFLDFESYNPAVPPYDGLRPYQQIPFQYSLHWLEAPEGELKHAEFLGEPEKSPCRDLAEQLCRDIPTDVCVTAYNMSFEKTVIKELAAAFPDLSDHLTAIHDHIRDLMDPFKGLAWYLPAMEGSYSIKYVLPALYPDDPELDYHNLEGVHKGTEASAAFPAMAEMAPEEREETRRNLLKYCGLDTLAMVRVWERMTKEVYPG